MAGMIDQHAAPSAEEIPENQTSEEQDAVKLVNKKFAQAKKHKELWDHRWVEYYQFFRGKQWKQKRPPYRHSEVLNFTHAAIQTIVPILTDNRPTIEAIPEDPSDFKFAEVVSKLLLASWDRENWAEVVAEALIDASIYGTAIGYVPWNPELFRGLGDYDFLTIDPMYFFPDPDAEDINDNKGEYFIVAEPTSVAKVKRMAGPEKAGMIKADVSDSQDAKLVKADIGDTVIKSAADARTLVEGDTSDDPEGTDKVLLKTMWVFPNEMIEEELEEDDGEGGKKTVFQARKKYPKGRKIVVASNVLIEDIANPYEDGKAPYAKLIDHILPREFWGDGEVSHLMSPQRMMNTLVSYVMDVLVLMGNPIWKVPNGAGVDTDNLVNSPGLVIEYNTDGGEPKREEGVQLQPFILQTLDRLQSLLEKISGIAEVSQGVAPGAGSSGVQVELLQEAAQTKLRLKGRNLEAFLSKIGQLMVSRILQFYTVPRVFRITNSEEGAEFFRFNVEQETLKDGSTQQTAVVTPFAQDEETGEFSEQSAQRMQIKGPLDIKISTGTSLPFAKAQKAQRAEKLLEIGIMDEEDFLQAIDWPGAEKLIAKFRERQAQAQENAAMGLGPDGQPLEEPQG